MKRLAARCLSAVAAALAALALLAIPPASAQTLGAQQRISQMGPDGNPAFDAFGPAMAHNPQANEYLVVWPGDATDDEWEIFGRLVDGAGNPRGATFRISTMGPDGNANFDAEDVAVVYNPQANEYLVTWLGDDNTAPLVDGEEEVFGQRLTASGAEIGPDDFRISSAGPDGNTDYRVVEPVIAYNTQANEYLVSWAANDNTPPLSGDETEIYGQRLTATGAEVGTDDFRISAMGPDGNGNLGGFHAAVAYNPQANEYLVTWFGDDNTAPLVAEEMEIYGQRLTATGAEVGTDDFRISAMGPDGNADIDGGSPDVAYNPAANEYLVTWHGEDNAAPLVDNEFEIYGQRLTATGEETGSDDFRISAMGPDGNASFDANGPDVAYNPQANEYLVTWRGDDNTPLLVDEEFEIFAQRLTAVGASSGTDDFRISTMGPDGNANFDAGEPSVAYNPQVNEYLAAWVGDDNTAPLVDNELEIFARRAEAGVPVSAPPDTDVDDDGSHVPADCNDANAGIRPGAVDIPGNGVDEDCSGADAQAQNPPPPDGDGVLDSVDQCPTVPGPAPSGCPPVVQPPPDATAGVPTACLTITPAIRKRTKLVPGGGEVLLTVSQTADAAVPLKLTIGARRGVKVKALAFKVNKKALPSASTKALAVPLGNLKIGKRNAISVVVTLTNNKKVTVNDFVGLTKCELPPVTCERLAGGTQLKCNSTMPLRARSVAVSVFGADGKTASGKARVTAKKGAKKGSYTLTMKTPATFLPGRHVYKHVATTTRKGEKLLAVRVLNLK